MAFLGNLGSVVGALGSLLPGYMQGERQAVQDNWADLNYYNKAQAGQLQNMYDERVMNDRINMAHDNALMQSNVRANSDLDLFNNYLYEPYTIRRAQWDTAYADQLNNARIGLTLAGADMALNSPLSLLGAMGLRGTGLGSLSLGGIGLGHLGLGGTGLGSLSLGGVHGAGLYPSRM